MAMSNCFVIQGFGKKTDYTDGRVLDLDASYEVIKEAVQACGLKCTRADEINHSGTIDMEMYERLLVADVVIADLSTYNINAAFELGVRYGLRPHATLVVAENGFKPAFDIAHIVIRRYEHLGADIGNKEARRFRTELEQAIKRILEAPDKVDVDSPVYTFLQDLDPPRRQQILKAQAQVEGKAEEMAASLKDADAQADAHDALAAEAAGAGDPAHASCKTLRDLAMDLKKAKNFAELKTPLRELQRRSPNDFFVVQQLAQATFKDAGDDPLGALLEAREILREISPQTTNNPGTLALWGSIHKRLWEIEHKPEDLDESIEAYERGFYIRQDHYHGIDYAVMLETRALYRAGQGQLEEARVDQALARRARHTLLKYLDRTLGKPDKFEELDAESKFWILSAAQEACVALGLHDAALDFQARAAAANPTDGMVAWKQARMDEFKSLRSRLEAALAPA